MRWPFRRKADAESAANPATADPADAASTTGGPTTAGGHAGDGGSAGVAGGPAAGSGYAGSGSAGGGVAGGLAADGDDGAAGGGGTGAVVRPPARQWATLPVIPVTIPSVVPLVVGPAPVVPPLRLSDRGGASMVEPAVGTVTGLAQPVVRAVEPVAPVERADVPLTPIVRRPVRAVPAEVTPLTDAVDEFVGEPRVPAEPYRAPAWLRYTPDWLKQGLPGPGLPGLPASVPDLPLSEPPSFLPPELRNPPKVELPPRVAESVQPAAELTAPVRKRRNSLGQSRRLGLGAPISKAELVHPEEPPPIVDGTVESPQEPPPPPAAPARVEPEPEPARDDRGPQDPPTAGPTAGSTAPTGTDSLAGADSSASSISPAAGSSSGTGATAPGTGLAAPVDGPGSPASVGISPITGPAQGDRTRPASGAAKAVVATYRATPELRPAPRRRELPRATVVDRVPAALANEVRARQQADVSSVPVYRGQKVSEAARSRGARAFASGGAVFLPDEAGPVDSPKARGLLAHELTHAVQQRTFGPRLPAPETPIGRRLEAEAQAAERFYSGEAGAAEPSPLIHAPLPAPAPQPEPDLTAVAQLATELAPAPAPQTTSQPTHSPFDAVQTAEVGRIATDSAKHVVAEWTNPTLQKQNGAGGTPPTHPAAGGAQPGAGGTHTPARAGTPARGGAAFNAAARRDQLITQALAMRNAALLGGEAAVTDLSDDEMAAVNNQVAMEAAQAGVTVPSNEPPAQHYEANSGKAWMHALTGMNMNYGLGLTGFKEPVGSEKSWWGSETGDKRPVGEKLADQFGLINENTETQFDTDTWYQDDKKDAAAAATSTDQQQPQHEESLYGRPNPDKSTVDVSRLDLDDLATRLYDRLRTRLRTELLVDRERAGLLTDFR